MSKEEIKEMLEPYIGQPKIYGGKTWCLESYVIDEIKERVYLKTTNGKQYDRPYDGLDAFLDILKPDAGLDKIKEPFSHHNPSSSLQKNTQQPQLSIIQVSEGVPETFADLKKILLNNIDGMRKGTVPINVAKEISNHAQTIVNITKLELEYARKLNLTKNR